jgi:hypothetical protein
MLRKISGEPWTSKSFSGLGLRAFVRIADGTIARLKDLGVQVPPGSRLLKARAIAEDLGAGRMRLDARNPQEVAVAAEAVRTIWDFSLIAERVPAGHLPTLANVRRMLSGVILPAPGQDDSARNYQFQLYVGAVFAMGDVPVRGEEPDLRFLLDDREYGLAVKRVRRVRKLRARVSDGVKQLTAAGVPGLVVVNVEAFLEGLALVRTTAEEAGRQFDARVGPLHAQLPKLANKRHALGLLGMGTVVTWELEEKAKLHMTWFLQFRWLTGSATIEPARTDAFVKRFGARVNQRLEGIFGQATQ